MLLRLTTLQINNLYHQEKEVTVQEVLGNHVRAQNHKSLIDHDQAAINNHVPLHGVGRDLIRTSLVQDLDQNPDPGMVLIQGPGLVLIQDPENQDLALVQEDQVQDQGLVRTVLDQLQ